VTVGFFARSADRIALCRAVDAYIARVNPGSWSEKWEWVEAGGLWMVEVQH